MRTLSFILVAAILIVGAQSIHAETYHSGVLGYTVSLPSGWIILDQQKMRTEPAMLETAIDNANKGAWKTADKDMLRKVKQMVDSGTVEYYLNSKYPGSTISVSGAQEKLPQTDADITKLCKSLPGEITKLAGKPIRVYECEAVKLTASTALFVAADAYVEGEKSFQYEIQKSPDAVLIFTATCQEQSCEAMRKDLTNIVESVNFK